MHQFVQSAIDAAKQGDNAKAMAFLKQVLNANPNDVDAWLVLAAVVDDPQRKRQCLNRVLTLDPVNTVAREELLDMDRADMGIPPLSSFEPTQPSASTQEMPVPVSNYSYQPETSSALYSTGTSTFEPEETPPPAPKQTKPQTSTKATVKTPPAQKGKTQVFKFSLYVQIMMYAGAAFCGFIGWLMLSDNMLGMGATVIGAGVLMLVLVMVLLPVAEVTDKGIKASGFFSSGEATWDEIVKIKSNNMKSRLELIKRNKQVVNISTQLSGYPQIVEILRQKRPELFGMAPRSQAQSSVFSSSYDDGVSANYGNTAKKPSVGAGYKGSRTFKKGFFRQFGLSLFSIVLCLCLTSVTLQSSKIYLKSILGIVFLFIAIIASLFQVGKVKVEGNKLSISTLFGTKEFTSQQIRDIYIKSTRQRYGRIAYSVCIQTTSGKEYNLDGFPDGNEIIHGALNNWLDANRR